MTKKTYKLGVAVIAVPLALLCGFLLGLAGTGGLMSLLTLVAVMILFLSTQVGYIGATINPFSVAARMGRSQAM